jgi:hypothetical protein
MIGYVIFFTKLHKDGTYDTTWYKYDIVWYLIK